MTLGSLLTKLREGRYVVPDFQREFEWEPWDIRDLVRSVFLDYYIGSLLLWKGTKDNFHALSCEPIYGVVGNDRDLIVLDGQQRLTAIHYAFVGPREPLPKRKSEAIFIIHVDNFMADRPDIAFDYLWRSNKTQEMLDDRERQFAAHWFPCHLLGSTGWELPNWLQDYERFWQRHAAELEGRGDKEAAHQAHTHFVNAHEFGVRVQELIQQYQISYIELDTDLPIDVVCDVFTKLNSKGVRLDIFDLLNALVKPKGIQLKEMWRRSSTSLAFIDSDKLNIYVLQVMSILKQAYCSPKYLYFLIPGNTRTVRDQDGQLSKIVLINDSDEFIKAWENAVSSLERTIETIRHPHEYGAIGSRFVPYAGIFPVMAALMETVRALPSELRLSANDKIRQWYWASVFSNRYSGSTESTSATDFRDLTSWFDDDERKPEWISRLGRQLDELDLEHQFNTGSSTYKGVFNLLIRAGARDWSTGMVPSYQELDDHHIVPKSWGNQHLNKGRIDTILNRTPLSVETNRNVISDRLPNVYLAELIERNGRRAVESVLATHLVSPPALDILLREHFSPSDFEEFITERKIAIREHLRTTLLSARPEVSADLAEMDDQLRTVELGIRQLTDTALKGDVLALPDHVRREIDLRVSRESSKNPTFDEAHYLHLSALLEFSDLRELQQIIVSKQLWPAFYPIFLNKVEVEQRFDKLSALRNAIRHDRNVTAQTRIDGEAAINWFTTVLRRFALAEVL